MMNPTLNFISLFLVLGSFLGLTLSPFLLLIKSSKNRANIFLGLSVVAFSFYILPGFLNLIGLLEYFPHLIRINALSGFAIGPIIYFYVQACTQKGFQFAPKYFLHFVPMLLDLVANMPMFLLSGAEKIEIMKAIYETEVLNEAKILVFIKIVHVFIYFLFSVKLVWNYRNHLSHVTSSIDKGFHRWLLTFCSSLLIPLIGVLVYFISNQKLAGFSILFFAVFLYFFSIYLAILFKPEFFHAFPNKMPQAEAFHSQKKKYEKSGLSNQQKDRLVEKLIQYIQEEKPYQEPELTLTDLADRVNIPANYLSQVINEKMNCTFMDFINRYRVEEAKLKLRDEKFSHYTIIAIAYEVGFNSKSAFYAAFKKHVQTTPSEYRKRREAYV